MNRAIRWLVGRLPREQRHKLVRRHCEYDLALLDSIEIRLARREDDYRAAFALVHDAYVSRGWLKRQRSGEWIASHLPMPEATLLLLLHRGRPIGTISVIEDSPLGLPIDGTFRFPMAELRRPGRRVAELASLALAPEHRSTGLAMCLTVTGWRYARHVLGVTDLVISVDAHIADYYEALFQFRTFTPVASYLGFPGKKRAKAEDPVVGLHQDLTTIDAFIAQHWGPTRAGRFSAASLAEAPFPSPREQLPSLPQDAKERARFKLPREVFRALYARTVATDNPLEPEVRRYLEDVRTEETLSRVDRRKNS